MLDPVWYLLSAASFWLQGVRVCVSVCVFQRVCEQHVSWTILPYYMLSYIRGEAEAWARTPALRPIGSMRVMPRGRPRTNGVCACACCNVCSLYVCMNVGVMTVWEEWVTCQVLIYIAPRIAQFTVRLWCSRQCSRAPWAVRLLTPQRPPPPPGGKRGREQ